MANKLYPLGRQAFLEGGIAYLTDTIKVALLDSSYVYSGTHQFWSDVNSHLIGTAQALGTKTSTNGTAGAANTTFTSVASGSTVGYLAIYKDTGTAGTSKLIGLIDTASLNGAASGTISFATNGGNIVVTWDSAGIWTL